MDARKEGARERPGGSHGYFLAYAAQFLCLSLRQHSRILRSYPDVISFYIQNFIPYKSQRAKATSKRNGAKEFQTGTAGAQESTKKGARVPVEGSDTYLGAGCRRFEKCHSDQKPLKPASFRGFYHTYSEPQIRVARRKPRHSAETQAFPVWGIFMLSVSLRAAQSQRNRKLRFFTAGSSPGQTACSPVR